MERRGVEEEGGVGGTDEGTVVAPVVAPGDCVGEGNVKGWGGVGEGKGSENV